MEMTPVFVTEKITPVLYLKKRERQATYLEKTAYCTKTTKRHESVVSNHALGVLGVGLD